MDFSIVENQIKKGEAISPFFFIGENLELLHSQLESYLKGLLQEYSIDRQSLFHLHDVWESLKIWEIKNFIIHWDIKPRFAFQIFLIENISRMTLQSANACLKFFEEPGKGNIIILTWNSESWILDTILSRVQVIHIPSGERSLSLSTWRETAFYVSMIVSHVSEQSDELVRYFFSGKYEKEEYVKFLYALIEYISKTWNFSHLLDEIHEDIWGILRNNLQGRYVVDKYVIHLSF